MLCWNNGLFVIHSELVHSQPVLNANGEIHLILSLSCIIYTIILGPSHYFPVARNNYHYHYHYHRYHLYLYASRPHSDHQFIVILTFRIIIIGYLSLLSVMQHSGCPFITLHYLLLLYITLHYLILPYTTLHHFTLHYFTCEHNSDGKVRVEGEAR